MKPRFIFTDTGSTLAVHAAIPIQPTNAKSLPLDIAALERTFDAIVQRPESLRTRFVAIDSEAIHVVGSGVVS